MATATERQGEDLSTLTCAICFEFYSEPRKLPSCSHSFCEHCIFRYVTILKTKDFAGEFKCPFCSQLNLCSDIGEDVLEWVQRLETDDALIQNVNSYIGGGNVELCIRCKESEKSIKASKFCLDCEEHFCDNCCDFGHKFKALKNHSFITINVDKTSLDKELNINQTMQKYLKCPVHPDESLTLLCEDGETFHCTSCAIENHHFTKIADSVTKEQNNLEAKKLLDKYEKLTAVIKAIIEVSRVNEVENKTETERIITQIWNMKAKLINLFDSLEETVRDQCKALTKKYAIAALEDIQTLQEVINDLESSRLLLEKSQKHQVSLNLYYIIIQNLKQRLNDHEITVLELREECKKRGFDLVLEEELNTILDIETNEMERLAVIEESENVVTVPEYTERCLLRHASIEKYAEYKIRAQGINELPIYTAVLFLPDHRMVLVDNANGLCCLVDTDYKVISTCKLVDTHRWIRLTAWKNTPFLLSQSFGLALLKNETLAISVPEHQKLIFVSADESLKIIGEMCTKYMPVALYGLSNGDMAVSWGEPCAFGIVRSTKYFHYEETRYFDRDRTGRTFKSFLSMAVDEKRLHVIQACTEDKKVYGFDFEGNPKFAYSHRDLQKPYGVTLDTDCNIYVNSYTNSCMHIISPDGIAIRILRDNCRLTKPIHLAFKRGTDEFAVTKHDFQRKVSIMKLKFGE